MEIEQAVRAARAHRERSGWDILDEFAGLLALPNVSHDLGDVVINGEAIFDAFDRRGADTVTVAYEGVAPLVVARIGGEGPETIGFYAHYDGQPVDPAQWSDAPFRPTLRTAPVPRGGEPLAMPAPGDEIDPEWRLYARSAADDKAPIVAMLAALDALQAEGWRPRSNLVFCFEGEEEIGSPHLARYLEDHRDLLAADVWLICDGPVHQSGRPQLAFGIRGITEMEITVYGPVRDLHSGHYGNWAPNPAQRLASLLASLKDDEGNVMVEGFYEGTRPIGEADRTAIAALPAYDDDLRRELGIAVPEGGGAALVERLMLPSLNVRGLAAGGVGEHARNVVPATATASIDIRLAPGDDPVEMLDRVEAHIAAAGYHIVREEPTDAERAGHPRLARIVRTPGYPGTRLPTDDPLARRLLAAAVAAAGRQVVAMPTMGGSVPVHAFTDVLGAPIVIVPIANHDNNQHAADENLRIGNLWYGIDLMAALFAL